MTLHHEKLKFKLLSMELPATIYLSICQGQQPGALSRHPILMPLLCVSSTRKPSCSSNRDTPPPLLARLPEQPILLGHECPQPDCVAH